jgi:GxxExxY protein
MSIAAREPLAVDLHQISGEIVDAAMEVHTHLGPGLLESAYEACLLYELNQRGFRAIHQVPLPVEFKGVKIDAAYRIDLVVNDAVVVEIKSVDAIAPIHKAQLLSYLKLSGKKLGLLLNFNVPLLKQGIVRLVNEL